MKNIVKLNLDHCDKSLGHKRLNCFVRKGYDESRDQAPEKTSVGSLPPNRYDIAYRQNSFAQENLVSPDIVIATSIAPKDIEKQQAAVATWIKLGFRPISVNCREELSFLKSYFRGVEFIRADRTAAEIIGKPLIFFDDLLGALKSTGVEICGIINSDIHLRADAGFVDFISAEARDSLIYASRVDVLSLDHMDGIIYTKGFDCFFFDRVIINCFPPTVFAIGATWWDYWAVTVPVLRGVAVKKLVSPVGFHEIHSLNYSPRQWRRLGLLFSEYLRSLNFNFTTENLESSALSFLDFIERHNLKIIYCDDDRCNTRVDI